MLTRSNDEYIDHEKRIRIARERGADLFISIHADSTSINQLEVHQFTLWLIERKVDLNDWLILRIGF